MFPTKSLAKEEFSEVSEAPDTSSSSTSNRRRRRREDTNFQCPQCHRVFGRIEHLRRHTNSHGEARSFRCATCNKGFNRLDTLQRHELIHQKDPGVSKLKGARACKECASSKVRCNGTMPCERCSSKNVDCVYPSAASPAQALDSPSSAVSDYASTPGASENVTSSVLESATFPQQLGQSLPYIGHTNPYPEQHVANVAESWNYNPHPESTSQSAGFVPGSLPAYAQEMLPHGSGAQPRSTRESGSIVPQTSARAQSEPSRGAELQSGKLSRIIPQIFYSIDQLLEPYTSFKMLSDQTYSSIYRSFTTVCTGLTAYQPPYGSSCFPSRKTLNALVKVYLDRFHPVMPILHYPTLDLNGTHWILGLAIVTIGSHMSDFEQSEEYALCFDEFLRRAISALDLHEPIDRITLCQAKLLACINQIYSGEESWQESAYHEFLTDLVSFCQLEWKMSETGFTTFAPEGQEAEFWKRWVQLESCRRTGYAIWMLDTMWAYQFQVQPRLTLEDGRMPLPCQEVLWETNGALQWHHIFQFSPSNLTLLSSLQSLQNEKILQNTMGEFSRIILLHGFYHQCWELEKAEIQSQPRPQQMSTYTFWSNSTMESLELLQWSANSMVDAASGMEHPTLLHLHLARIVLFAPFQGICDLAYGMTKEDSSTNSAQMTALRRAIREWVTEDASKARLATLHAGALLRHLQAFHTNSFYEPSAVLLATLTLWTYGSFVTTARGAGPSSQRRYSDTQIRPISIAIDQPLDPELARSFVNNGGEMQPTLRRKDRNWYQRWADGAAASPICSM
ncbi:hypothetical protein KCU83_g9, partial [Aureobasidium melanogenum]